MTEKAGFKHQPLLSNRRKVNIYQELPRKPGQFLFWLLAFEFIFIIFVMYCVLSVSQIFERFVNVLSFLVAVNTLFVF